MSKTTSSIKTSKILIGPAGVNMNELTIGSNETNTSFRFMSGNKVVFEFGTIEQQAPVVDETTGDTVNTTTASDGTVTETTTNSDGQVIKTVVTETSGTVTTVTTTLVSNNTVTAVSTDSATNIVTTTVTDLLSNPISTTTVYAVDGSTGHHRTVISYPDGSGTETVMNPSNGQQIEQTQISTPDANGQYTRTTTYADGSIVEKLYDSSDTLLTTTTTSAPDANGETTTTIEENTVSTTEDETTVTV